MSKKEQKSKTPLLDEIVELDDCAQARDTPLLMEIPGVWEGEVNLEDIANEIRELKRLAKQKV